jgi:FtsP/CotA-like multicopper oxidase with cupredoxin domain
MVTGRSRRQFLQGAVAAGIVAIAGCSGSGSSTRITNKEVMSGDGRMGVRLTVKDGAPDEQTQIEVHGKLMDAGDEVAGKHKKMTLASQQPKNVDFWFDNVEPADGYTAQGHIHKL